MKEITLEQPKEVLKINIHDKSFTIPLAGSIPFKDLADIQNAKTKEERFDMITKFFEKYIPEDIFSELTTSELNQIMVAWGEVSETDTGITPGES